MSIPHTSFINDIRQANDFRICSFSRYKRLEVKKALLENLLQGHVEPAAYWSAEMICAGLYSDLWDVLILCFSKHIHLANAKIAIYIANRYTVFKNIVTQGNFIRILDLRNNQTIRRLFAELVCNLALCDKKSAHEPLKLNCEEEFEMEHMTHRLKATSTEFAQELLAENDPDELFIPMNELCYHVGGHGNGRDEPNPRPNMMMACYWIQWMLEYDILCKSRKDPCWCERRNIYGVDPKYQKNLIWLVWEGLMKVVETKEGINTRFLKRAMESAQELFCVNYTPTNNKKRLSVLYFAVSLLTEYVPVNTELVKNQTMLDRVLANINLVYEQIQKNATKPPTDYLFVGMEEENRNQSTTMDQLRWMEELDPVSGPELSDVSDDDQTVTTEQSPHVRFSET